MKSAKNKELGHAANDDVLGVQNQHRGRRHHTRAFITRCSIELKTSGPPLLAHMADVQAVELPRRSLFRHRTSGTFSLNGDRLQIHHGDPENRCWLNVSSPDSYLDAEEVRRAIRFIFEEARTPRIVSLELCLQAHHPGVKVNVFGDPVSNAMPSRPPKSQCNAAGLLWNAVLQEHHTRLLVRVELARPFLASRGVRSLKDVLRLRNLTLPELISPTEMEKLPLPFAFCCSPEELAQEFGEALRELFW